MPRGGGRAGAGRPKGSRNKITRDLQEMILAALDEAGGVEYLAATATATPAAFLALLGKILPLKLTGKDGGPIEFADVRDRLAQKLARLSDDGAAGGDPQRPD